MNFLSFLFGGNPSSTSISASSLFPSSFSSSSGTNTVLEIQAILLKRVDRGVYLRLDIKSPVSVPSEKLMVPKTLRLRVPHGIF